MMANRTTLEALPKSVPKAALQFVARSDVALMPAKPDAKSRQIESVAMTQDPEDASFLSALLGMPTITDFATLKPDRNKLPVLLQHDPSQRAGYTRRFDIGETVKVAGTIMAATLAGQEVLTTAEEGFPWQQSVGMRLSNVRIIEEGESVKVNGKEHEGPIAVLEGARIDEVSFVSIGADKGTSATVLADDNGERVELKYVMSSEQGGTAMAEQDKKTIANAEAAETHKKALPKEDRPPKLTFETVRAEFGEQIDSLVGERVKQCMAEERDRIKTIRSAVVFEGQRELADKLIDEGTPAMEAVLKLNADAKRVNAEKLAEMAAGAPAPVGIQDKEPISKRDKTIKVARHEWQEMSDECWADSEVEWINSSLAAVDEPFLSKAEVEALIGKEV
jgi:phage head maturation protease